MGCNLATFSTRNEDMYQGGERTQLKMRKFVEVKRWGIFIRGELFHVLGYVTRKTDEPLLRNERRVSGERQISLTALSANRERWELSLDQPCNKTALPGSSEGNFYRGGL